MPKYVPENKTEGAVNINSLTKFMDREVLVNMNR